MAAVAGAARSMVKVVDADPVLPAVSVATTRAVYAPSVGKLPALWLRLQLVVPVTARSTSVALAKAEPSQ